MTLPLEITGTEKPKRQSPDCAQLRIKAQAVVDAISFDNNGVMVGTIFTGGNGGLYSLDTLKAADALRKELLRETQ